MINRLKIKILTSKLKSRKQKNETNLIVRWKENEEDPKVFNFIVQMDSSSKS
jgi:hypothetical protein